MSNPEGEKWIKTSLATLTSGLIDRKQSFRTKKVCIRRRDRARKVPRYIEAAKLQGEPTSWRRSYRQKGEGGVF